MSRTDKKKRPDIHTGKELTELTYYRSRIMDLLDKMDPGMLASAYSFMQGMLSIRGK